MIAAMVTPPAVLFDLDGTLSDAAPGMVASFAFACSVLGLPVPGEDELRAFIGPPFEVAFATRFGLGPTECARALAAYRRHYVDEGAMYDTAAFPGVAELVRQLADTGHLVAIATSKPQPFAARIVEHLGLGELVTAVFGPGLDERGSTKATVIAEALRVLGLDPATTVMVGDREHDVIGAAAHAMACIGVLWGFGSADELRRAGAAALAGDAGELAALLRDGALAKAAAPPGAPSPPKPPPA